MSYSYDLATPVGVVRLLAADTDTQRAIFTDAEISTYLILAGGSRFLAAALALDYVATDAAKCAVITKSDVLSTDPTKMAELVAARAATLREQASMDPDFQAILIADAQSDGPDPVFTTSHLPDRVSSMNGW